MITSLKITQIKPKLADESNKIPYILKMNKLDSLDVFKGITSALEKDIAELNLCSIYTLNSDSFTGKIEALVADLLNLSEDEVEMTVSDAKNVVNALINVVNQCDQKDESPKLSFLRNDLEKIKGNLIKLASNEESFIANVIKNEKELRKDIRNMGEA